MVHRLKDCRGWSDRWRRHIEAPQVARPAGLRETSSFELSALPSRHDLDAAADPSTPIAGGAASQRTLQTFRTGRALGYCQHVPSPFAAGDGYSGVSGQPARCAAGCRRSAPRPTTGPSSTSGRRWPRLRPGSTRCASRVRHAARPTTFTKNAAHSRASRHRAATTNPHETQGGHPGPTTARPIRTERAAPCHADLASRRIHRFLECGALSQETDHAPT